MAVNKLGVVAVVAVSGALVLGGAALANAATGTTAPPSATAGATDTDTDTDTDQGPDGGGRGGGSNDTPVTGDELAKVTAAMKAKDSAVTVTSVRKDPDGSYDVLATLAGAAVMFDVSADLKTFSQHTGGGDRGHGGDHGTTSDGSGTSSSTSSPQT